MNIFKSVFVAFLFFIYSPAFAQTNYDAHLQAAKKSGIVPLQGAAHISALLKKKKLSHIYRQNGYTIAKLNYSRPYLTPKSYKVLKQIGNSFYSKSKKKTFTITSVTRTLDDQKRLARVNSNAVTSKLSSHNYGCSFDISYIRFNKKKAPNARLERILEQTLIQYRNQGKIYFIKENREMCFHVTVR